MELKDLFTRGSKLSDVPPDFRGMPYREWRRLEMARQAERYRAKLDPAEAPLSKQRIWTPRDGYGMKGF